MRLNLFVAMAFVAMMAAPSAMAGPLPLPEDWRDLVPNPDPYEPQDAESFDQVEKILKELFPEDAPFHANCLKSEDRRYDPDEYPGQPVSVENGEEHVSVHIWNAGTRTTIKIQADCTSG